MQISPGPYEKDEVVEGDADEKSVEQVDEKEGGAVEGEYAVEETLLHHSLHWLHRRSLYELLRGQV